MTIPTASFEAIRERIEAARAGSTSGAIAFDGDGTLWSGDIGEDFFHAFLEHDDVRDPSVRAIVAMADEFGVPSQGDARDVADRIFRAYERGEVDEERVCELTAWCPAGWKPRELESFCRGLVEYVGLRNRVQLETMRAFEWARAEGLRCLLVSASPEPVIVAATRLVGFDGEVLAARPACEADVFRAECVRPIPYGAGKVLGLEAALGDIPLLAAFGDNAFDVPMLQRAKVPVAIRPKDRLRARAAEVPGLVELAREG